MRRRDSHPRPPGRAQANRIRDDPIHIRTAARKRTNSTAELTEWMEWALSVGHYTGSDRSPPRSDQARIQRDARGICTSSTVS